MATGEVNVNISDVLRAYGLAQGSVGAWRGIQNSAGEVLVPGIRDVGRDFVSLLRNVRPTPYSGPPIRIGGAPQWGGNSAYGIDLPSSTVARGVAPRIPPGVPTNVPTVRPPVISELTYPSQVRAQVLQTQGTAPYMTAPGSTVRGASVPGAAPTPMGVSSMQPQQGVLNFGNAGQTYTPPGPAVRTPTMTPTITPAVTPAATPTAPVTPTSQLRNVLTRGSSGSLRQAARETFNRGIGGQNSALARIPIIGRALAGPGAYALRGVQGLGQGAILSQAPAFIPGVNQLEGAPSDILSASLYGAGLGAAFGGPIGAGVVGLGMGLGEALTPGRLLDILPGAPRSSSTPDAQNAAGVETLKATLDSVGLGLGQVAADDPRRLEIINAYNEAGRVAQDQGGTMTIMDPQTGEPTEVPAAVYAASIAGRVAQDQVIAQQEEQAFNDMLARQQMISSFVQPYLQNMTEVGNLQAESYRMQASFLPEQFRGGLLRAADAIQADTNRRANAYAAQMQLSPFMEQLTSWVDDQQSITNQINGMRNSAIAAQQFNQQYPGLSGGLDLSALIPAAQ